MYSETVLDHFNNPRNAEGPGDSDAVGRAGTPGQGNYMVISLREEGGRIAEARFQTYGCPAAIACGSWLTERVTGMSADDAKEITPDAITEGLGGLPLGKEHCAKLASDALRDALNQTRLLGKEK